MAAEVVIFSIRLDVTISPVCVSLTLVLVNPAIELASYSEDTSISAMPVAVIRTGVALRIVDPVLFELSLELARE